MFEMKNVALLVKLHSFLIKIYSSVVCFLLLKCVCVFLPMVLMESCLQCFSSRQYVSMTFVKQCTLW